MVAYFSFREGSHRKHCDFARSCFSHQSPAFLCSAATLLLHMLHSASGSPCSSHHQLLCFVPFSSTICLGLPAPFSALATSLEQPPMAINNVAVNESSPPI